MKNALRCFSLMALLLNTAGCAICCAPDDYTYATYGGKYQRVDPAYGRVGSIFSDPNAHWGIPFEPKAGEPMLREGTIPEPSDPMTVPPTEDDTAIPSILYGASKDAPRRN